MDGYITQAELKRHRAIGQLIAPLMEHALKQTDLRIATGNYDLSKPVIPSTERIR